jgi:hypothetical protein
MSIFPNKGNFTPGKKASEENNPILSSPTLIMLLKKGHDIIKSLVAADIPAAKKKTEALEALMGVLDTNDDDVKLALATLVMTTASQVPPSVYGGSSNDIIGH